MSPTKTCAHVIIIGAGAAGIGAARTLSDLGITPIVLEARNRIGGRIDTRDAWSEASRFQLEMFVSQAGYIRVLEKLMNGLDIRLEHIVKEIHHDDDGVRIETDHGTFDAKGAGARGSISRSTSTRPCYWSSTMTRTRRSWRRCRTRR